MATIEIEERVKLTHDIPELELHRGEIGQVCSTWLEPLNTYEVEFHRGMPGQGIRALLMCHQIQRA